MKRAVILAGPGFEDSELIYPYYRLQEAGFKVDIATKGNAEVFGKHGVPFKADVDMESLDPSDYDLVVVPGGYEAPDRVRQVRKALDFVAEMDKRKKTIAAVCHGPWVLISAGIMRGKNATCYPGCKDDLINAGANYRAAAVVVDGNIVTSPHFRDMAAWMKEVLKVCK